MNIKQDLTNDQAKALRWVYRAAATLPGRGILCKVLNIKSDTVNACDGWRWHSTKNEYSYDEGNYYLNKAPTKTGTEFEEVDGNYPDIKQLRDQKIGDEPAFEIYVNPKYLADACKDLKGSVKLTFYDELKPMEIRGKLNDKWETEVYAMIMPMYK